MLSQNFKTDKYAKNTSQETLWSQPLESPKTYKEKKCVKSYS